MSDEKKPRYVLSPELSDGNHEAVVDNAETVIASLREWLEYAEPGDFAGVKIVEMTDAEVEELPDI